MKILKLQLDELYINFTKEDLKKLNLIKASPIPNHNKDHSNNAQQKKHPQSKKLFLILKSKEISICIY